MKSSDSSRRRSLRELMAPRSVVGITWDGGCWPVAAFFVVALFSGCGYYSFTGASIPPHLATVAIPLVDDASTSLADDADVQLTRFLTDRFIGQTRLQLSTEESEADAVLNARIERIAVEPVAVGGGDVALENRVTVSVRAEYLDMVQDRELVQRTFSASVNYDPSAGDERVLEIEAISEALRNVADDIFTAATSNW